MLIIYLKNASQKGKMDKILALSALCNLYTCYMKNVLVFSQSDAHDFLMYIIRSVMRMFVLKCMFDLFFFLFIIYSGGGFHHCSGSSGGGFCAYADITLAIKVNQLAHKLFNLWFNILYRSSIMICHYLKLSNCLFLDIYANLMLRWHDVSETWLSITCKCKLCRIIKNV